MSNETLSGTPCTLAISVAYSAEPTIESIREDIERIRRSSLGFHDTSAVLAALIIQLADRIEKLEQGK